MVLLKSATIQLRVTPEVKVAAERVVHAMGLTMSQAVELFLRRIIIDQRLPFEVAALENVIKIKTGLTDGFRTEDNLKEPRRSVPIPKSKKTGTRPEKEFKNFFGGGQRARTKPSENTKKGN